MQTDRGLILRNAPEEGIVRKVVALVDLPFQHVKGFRHSLA